MTHSMITWRRGQTPPDTPPSTRRHLSLSMLMKINGITFSVSIEVCIRVRTLMQDLRVSERNPPTLESDSKRLLLSLSFFSGDLQDCNHQITHTFGELKGISHIFCNPLHLHIWFKK